MQIKIGSFSKRHNSTKQPANSWGTTLSDVELKEDCSMEEPVFRIGFANWNTAYNYIYIPSWNRYYFVIDVTVQIGRIWEVSCRLDAAATYKADITASQAFILYADVQNTEIIDSRLPTKTTATYAVNYATLSQSLMTGQWKIAVSVCGDDSTSTFLLTPAQVRSLVNATDFDSWFNQLWASITAEQSSLDNQKSNYGQEAASIANDITNISDDILGFKALSNAMLLGARSASQLLTSAIQTTVASLAKFFRKVIATPNAMDCIRSAVFLPWDVVGDGSMTNIMLGEYDTGIAALPVYNPIQHDVVSVSIPWQASDWRRNAPYHQIYLYLPFMGDVELSPSDLIDCASLKIYFSLNVMNGALNYRVATDKDTTIGVFSCQTGVSYPIGASNITPVSVGMGIAGAASAIMGAPTLAAAATAAASLAAIRPNSSCVGGGGGGAGSGLDMRIICHSVYHDTNVSPSNPSPTIGQPASMTASLSGFAGYVQTQGASIQGANMSDAVRQELNAMCDNGIFIE